MKIRPIIFVLALCATVAILIVAALYKISESKDQKLPVIKEQAYKDLLHEKWPLCDCIDFYNCDECEHVLMLFHFKGKLPDYTQLMPKDKMLLSSIQEFEQVYAYQYGKIQSHLPDDIMKWDAYSGGVHDDTNGTFLYLFLNKSGDEAIVLCFQIM